MHIRLTVLVDDQGKALQFYTHVLGLQKTELPLREHP
jgi:hypothetical protein